MKKKKNRPKADLDSKPAPLDESTKRVVEEFQNLDANWTTAGFLQASFHQSERRNNRLNSVYQRTFPIVAVGAAAGGIESFTELLSHLPSDNGMAFIFVQHLAPDHESLLPAILGRVSKMEVVAAENNMAVAPNRVYVIPPNVNMGILDGVLKLLPRLEQAGEHRPVDFLFRCLADDQAHLAVGVVLSGADGDGAEGLRAIRGNGGITMIQDPRSATVSGMPDIAVGATDNVLSIPEIASELSRLALHPLARETADLSAKDQRLGDLFRLLRHRHGVDFNSYKSPTILRRLRRRILLRKAESLDAYLQIVTEDLTESAELFRDFLINATSFFRDAPVFAAFQSKIVPALLSRTSTETLRIWVAACSTGEEVYSLAISILEVMDEKKIYVPIQIFATDLSDPALEKAREGYYGKSIAMDVSAERLKRYFVQTENGYQVAGTVRELCIFAKHDITQDPPFSRIDMVSCRNLLIYLEPSQQSRIMNIFAYSLNPGGVLLLGISETIGESEIYEAVDKSARIYKRKTLPSRSGVDISFSPNFRRLSTGARPGNREGSADLERAINRLLVDRFAPACLILSDTLTILQVRGSTGAYLEAAPGDMSLNVFRMARPGLDTELRVLLNRAKKTRKIARKEGVAIRGGDISRLISVEVLPLSLHETIYYLVLLQETRRKLPESRVPERGLSSRALNKAAKEEIEQLRTELLATREHMESTLREQDTGHEELQAANEEILSSNEELQSTNEELETAKEELQSSNEELSTVNDELANRNNLLLASNNDLNNLLASVNLPIVMVSKDLRIRRFTPQSEAIFNILSGDVGRPITHIKPDFDAPDLEQLILEAIHSQKTIMRDVEDRMGRAYSLRCRPYRTVDGKIEGAVVLLVDVADQARTSLPPSDPAGAFLEADQPILLLDHRLRIKKVNASYLKTFHVDAAGILGASIFDVNAAAWTSPTLKALFQEVLSRGAKIHDYRIDHEFPLVGPKSFLINARTLRSADSHLCVLVILDSLRLPASS